MTVTYFLMLLFVFVTLFFAVAGRLFTIDKGGLWVTFFWALLGTFFFHNIW